MKIYLISVGSRMPQWVDAGFNDYAKRLPPHLSLVLNEIPLAKRTKNTEITQAMQKEAEAIIKAIPSNCRIITLEIHGEPWSTATLAQHLTQWQNNGQSICFIIGGPDGLAPSVLKLAQQRWSLSSLTLPHPLVRVIVAEQLYRAWSTLENHPYHR